MIKSKNQGPSIEVHQKYQVFSGLELGDGEGIYTEVPLDRLLLPLVEDYYYHHYWRGCSL